MLHRMAGLLGSGRRAGTFYRKSFIWFLIAASVPGLIIGGVTYWFAAGSIEKEINELHQNQISERAQQIDDQFSSAELDISHWAFHPRFGPQLKELNFEYHFKDTWEITKILFMLQGSHPLINQVQLYIHGEKTVLFQPEYYELKDEQQIEGYERILAEGTNIYWTDRLPAAEKAASRTYRPLVLVHKIPGDSSSPFGVLVTELKREKVINLLKTMTPYNEGLTMLLDQDGNVLVSDSSEERKMDEAIRREVLRREEPSGTFLTTQGGITYSVSYGKLTRLSAEWTYISAAPMTAITSPVVAISNTIIIVSASGLLFALLLSWLGSRRVYSPVERLIQLLGGKGEGSQERGMDEFQYLEKQWNQLSAEQMNLRRRLEAQRPHVRAGFLLQLLQGHLSSLSEEDLKERMKLYGWEVDNHQFRILYIQLTGLERLADRFSQGDESLVTFAAANMAEELAAEYFHQFSVMNFHNLTAALLVMSPKGERLSEPLQALGEQITKAVNANLRMQVTILISSRIDRVRDIPDQFMAVERAMGYRKWVNQNQLIQLDHLPDAWASDEIQYPFALEREIIHAMRAGDKAEANRLVTLFFEEVTANVGTEMLVQQCMFQLFGSIQHAMLQSGVSTCQLFRGENMFALLAQLREPSHMLRWMKEKVIMPFMEEREARANIELRRMVEKTMDYIRANYASDISLEMCADFVGTSPYTLSKYFKQMTGINFIDYVTELRIEKAKRLLRETNLKINDIAVEVGYQQRYFNRIFKKQVGLTPGQFRQHAEA